MTTPTVRKNFGLPEKLLDWLSKEAAKNHRTTNLQLIAIVQAARDRWESEQAKKEGKNDAQS